MNDRLKFRFWHKPTQKMIDCYGFNEEFVFGDVLDGIGTEYNPAKFEDCILMQCTGLKDKNGKLIYEGDIVIDTGNPQMIAEVKYQKCSFTLENKGFIGYYHELGIGFSSKRLEVIGNIYKNKELLESEEKQNV